MTNVIVDASCKSLLRIACLNSSSVPGGVASIAKTDTGVLQIVEAIDPLTSSAAGVPSRVKIIPGSVGTATYGFTVYGSMRVGGSANPNGPWIWVPLYKASVAATLQYAGDESAGFLETTDYLPVTITAASNGPSDPIVTNYGSGVGPAHVVINTRGCQYLLCVADAANKFALVTGASGAA